MTFTWRNWDSWTNPKVVGTRMGWEWDQTLEIFHFFVGKLKNIIYNGDVSGFIRFTYHKPPYEL